MAAFTPLADAPFQIKTEGETITISFKPGVPEIGQGSIQWNIPTPAHGCQTSEEGRGAYCGIVVLLSDQPLTADNAPVNGVSYLSDPTADPDAHMGDKINGAFVIGAFYEGEKKARGETLTTSFVISDVISNKPYFIGGYAVDCQGRYHKDGVRAYSSEFGGPNYPDSPSTQVVELNGGVIPTDGTNLTPGFVYKFDTAVGIAPNDQIVKFSTDGLNISTYQDLLDEINKAFTLADNPPQSPVAPNTGRYYWKDSEQKLYLWDGTQHVEQDILIEPSDPANPQIGSYWYNSTTKILQIWQGSPGSWNNVSVIEYIEDPTTLQGGDDYWIDGTDNVYQWCGTSWCEQTTYISATDPNIPSIPTDCGVYWFDEINEHLYFWNVEEGRWVEKFAILWNVSPTTLSVGSYWFNSTDDALFVRSSGSPLWTQIPKSVDEQAPNSRVVIVEDEPTNPTIGLLWYKPSTEQMFEWNDLITEFEEVPVLTWPEDPTDTESCDLWWNSTTDVLSQWDVVHSQWTPVEQFTQSEIDPTLPPTFVKGDVWYNPSTDQMFRWDGVQWISVNFINHLTDPSLPNVGDTWFNPSTNQWYVWSNSPNSWTLINPIDSTNDPFTIPSGSLWFDTLNNILHERSGSSWITVPFVTNPLNPSRDDYWFDTTTDTLKQWTSTNLDGSNGQWNEVDPIVTASLNDDGNIVLTTKDTGTDACVMILIPSASGTRLTELAIGTAGQDCVHYGPHNGDLVRQTDVSVNQFLFDHLTPDAKIYRQTYGQDGLSSKPSYIELGVGDDGTPDERRALSDSVRSQFGYPTVEVELDNNQINQAINLALSELRLRSSVAYKRAMFFIDTVPGIQRYQLTSKRCGFNKVVSVLSAYRMTSAFLSNAYGSGVYGQVVLQHLYNMGTFDLVSFHLVAQYMEQLEHLFATRLTYHWDEPSRNLDFYHTFHVNERILLDTTIERSEQELFKDRWTKNWINRFTFAEGCRILAQVRGKYGSLPGAGGGISLNAAELQSQHDMLKEQLYAEIDDFLVNDIEDIGMQSTMIIG